MPVRTIRDLDLQEGSGTVSQEAEGNAASSSSSSSSRPMKLAHIPDLSQSDQALVLLRRIHNEFYPIAQRRGFNVLSLSEMCCCGDGLDHGHIDDDGKRRKRRKRKIMATNILGYNMTHFSRPKRHTIHLRLRNARNHNVMLSYQEVAGTMAHELAHCIHGKHDAKFYKLMDEIQEQHAVYLTRGLVTDTQGFPMNSQHAHVLGRGGTQNRGAGKKSAGDAAEARRKGNSWTIPQGGRKLGGNSDLTKVLSAGEAAAAAAQARRLEDEKWCLPCNEADVVELLESSDEEEEDEDQQDDRKLPAVLDATPDAAVSSVADGTEVSISGRDSVAKESSEPKRVTPVPPAAMIDLTGDSDDEVLPKSSVAKSADWVGSWNCHACTYHNEVPMVLVCSMCGAEKPNASNDAISKIVRHDAIESVKQREIEQSERDFGGFNIYGNTKKKTVVMKDLT